MKIKIPLLSKKIKALTLIFLIFSVFSIYSPLQDAYALTVWRFTPPTGVNDSFMMYKNLTSSITIPSTVNTTATLTILINLTASAGTGYVFSACLANKQNYFAGNAEHCQDEAGPKNNVFNMFFRIDSSGNHCIGAFVYDGSTTLSGGTNNPCSFQYNYDQNKLVNWTLYHWRNNGTGSGFKIFNDGIERARKTNSNNTMAAQTFNVFSFSELHSSAGFHTSFEIQSVSFSVNGVTKYSKLFANTPPDDYGQLNNGYTIQKISKGIDTFPVALVFPANLQVGDVGNITMRLMYQDPNSFNFLGLGTAPLTLWASSNGGINYANYSRINTTSTGSVLFQFQPTETPALGYYKFFIQYKGNNTGSIGYRGVNTTTFNINIGVFIYKSEAFNLVDFLSTGDLIGLGKIILNEIFNFFDILLLNPSGNPISSRITVEQLRTRDTLKVFVGFIPDNPIGLPPPLPPVYSDKVATNTVLSSIITMIVLPMIFLFTIIFIVLVKFKNPSGTTELVILPFILLGVNVLAWQSIIPQWVIFIEIVILGAAIAVMVGRTFTGDKT